MEKVTLRAIIREILSRLPGSGTDGPGLPGVRLRRGGPDAEARPGLDGLYVGMVYMGVLRDEWAGVSEEPF